MSDVYGPDDCFWKSCPQAYPQAGLWITACLPGLSHDSDAALWLNLGRVSGQRGIMASLFIIYHTPSGSCARLARAAWAGARRESSVTVCLRRAWDAGVADLASADGLLLVTAENSGSLSGGMKDFLDRSFYPAIDRGLVLPYALVVSAGNDGRGAIRQAERILSGIPFPKAVESLVLRGEVNEDHLEACAEMGQAFAAGLEMGIY